MVRPPWQIEPAIEGEEDDKEADDKDDEDDDSQPHLGSTLQYCVPCPAILTVRMLMDCLLPACSVHCTLWLRLSEVGERLS